MLLESRRPWRHRALVPMILTEAAKAVYVAKVTDKRVTVYVSDDKGGVKKVAVAHGSLAKYASKTVDPPPGEKPVGYVPDPGKYTGPKDVYPIEAPAAPEPSAPPEKQAKFVPVYDWNEKKVWVWVKKTGGKPVLTEIPHEKVRAFAKKLGWSGAKVEITGKIDPKSYTGPQDILPLDWESGDEGFKVPTADSAVSTVFTPEYDEPKVPEQAVLKPVVDAGLPKLQLQDEFETQKKKDPNGLPWVKHKGSGLNYSVLPTGALAIWDKAVGKYLPIKKTDSGWEVDHDAPIVSPKGLMSAQPADLSGPEADPAKGIEVAGKDPNGLPQYSITKPDLFPPDVPGSISWIPSEKVWGYLDPTGKTYHSLDWEDGEWWEGGEEYSAKAIASVKPHALPKEFKLPGDDYKIKTAAKGYVVVTTPEGENIKWVQKQDAWFYMDEPWKEWTPPSAKAPAPQEADAPALPEAPKGFELASSKPNKHGSWPLKTSQYADDGSWFMLPDGTLAKYSDYSGEYTAFEHGAAGWQQKQGADPIPAQAVKMMKFYGEALPIPDGFSSKGYDINGLALVWSGPGTPSFTLLPNGNLAKWSPSKSVYKTQLGTVLTIEQILSGEFGSDEKVTYTISHVAEDPALNTEYTGDVDVNGYPLVNEFSPDDPDATHTVKGLTLLPDERVAKWNKSSNAYMIYGYSSLEGYEPKWHETVGLAEVERLMGAFKLTVKNGRYHKMSALAVGTGAPVADQEQAVPGFEMLTPTAEEKGLVPAKHSASGKKYYLVPGNRAAGLSDSAAGIFDIYQIGEGGKLTPLNQQYAEMQVRVMTQGYDPEPPDHTEFATGVKKFDLNGLPFVLDEDGERLTLLPNGEVAKWGKAEKRYAVWSYDYTFGGYLPRHDEKSYSLKEAIKLKHKKLSALKKTQMPTHAPEPTAAPAKVDTKEPVKTGDKDPNGHDVYEYHGIGMSKIPVDTGWGVWFGSKGAYAVKYFDEPHDVYGTKFVGGETVFWYPGDADTHVGEKSASPGQPFWGWEDTGKKDEFDKPIVALKNMKTGKIRDYLIQLPVVDLLGKWSDANSAYVVHKIDHDPIPPEAMPVYNTLDLWYPSNEDAAGFQYPFAVAGWKLPKEWKPTPSTTKKGWVKGYEVKAALGTWNGEPAEFHEKGSISLPSGEVWNWKEGYVSGAKAKAPAPPPEPAKPDAKAVAADAKAAAKPSEKEGLFKELDLKVPNIEQLELVGDGNSLGMKGAGKKYVFRDPTTNKQYIFKPALPKSGHGIEPFRAHVQEAFAALATKIRPDHIPIKTQTYKGQLGTLQPMIELAAKKSDLSGVSPESLTKKQRDHVVVEHLLDWVMSQHDSHGGNMVFTADGGVLSIDKEQGYKYSDFDKLDIDFHPNAKYGEQEPFYNTFWRAFSEGKVDFDPQVLRDAIGRLDAVTTEEFVGSLRPYAKSAFPGNAAKQRKFLKRALARKLEARARFEEFLEPLHAKRAGKEGTFTIDDGWVGKGEGGPKTKWVKIPAQEYAASLKIKPPKPFQFKDPDTGQEYSDPERVTLSCTKELSTQVLEKFLDEIGVPPIPFPNGKTYIEGSINFLVSVDRKLFQAATIEKEVPITDQPTPAKPRYWYGIEESPPAPPNMEALAQSTSEIKTGSHGQRVSFDGGQVEGQSGKVRREKDSEGTYILKQFKLREGLWTKVRGLSGGKSATFHYAMGDYDAASDTYVYSSSKVGYGASFEAREFQTKHGQIYVAAGEFPATYRGSVYVKIRSEGNVDQLVKAMFNEIQSGLGDQLFKPPTAEELMRKKLFRAIWTFQPKKADALDERTPTAELVKLAKSAAKSRGYSQEDIDKIEDQEVYPGYHVEVLPDRWRKLAGGHLWFGIQSFHLKAVVPIALNGLQGIHERNWFGIPQSGASYSADQTSGAGDHAICRMVSERYANTSLASAGHGYGEYIAIFHPEVFDRMDSYMYMGDKYATAHPQIGSGGSHTSSSPWASRRSLEQVSEELAGTSGGGKMNEVMFRRGVSPDKVLRIVVGSEALRKKALIEANAAGVKRVRGMPIEDFVVVCSTCKEAWTKYVEPLVVL